MNKNKKSPTVNTAKAETKAPAKAPKAETKAPKAETKAPKVKAPKAETKAPAKAPKVKETTVQIGGGVSVTKAEVVKAGRPDDDAMNAGVKYELTPEGKADADALAKGLIVGLKCKVQHGVSVRWNIRAATLRAVAEGITEHGPATTYVNQFVAKYLKENGRAKQCQHNNGDQVKWRIGDDAAVMASGDRPLLRIIRPAKA